jgi:hypothetical protein
MKQNREVLKHGLAYITAVKLNMIAYAGSYIWSRSYISHENNLKSKQRIYQVSLEKTQRIAQEDYVLPSFPTMIGSFSYT